MSIQEILVYIIILFAVLYTIYQAFLIVKNKPGNSCGCSSCDVKNKFKELK